MKTGLKILLIVVTILVVIYILLPFILRDYVNKTINNLEGYQGRIEGVELSLLRGGYAVNGLQLERTDEDEPINYLEVDKIRLSLDYGPLLKGKVVSDIYLRNPILNVSPIEEDIEPDTTDWVGLLKDLMPININKLVVENGRINFIDFQTDPQVNVYLHDLDLVATNLSNVEADEALPSSISMSGTSIGGGALNVNMKGDFLREIPNLDVEFKFENIDLTAFNEMTQAYARFQFDTGALSIFSEIAVKEGIINGYVTPVMEEVQILSDDPDEDMSLLQRIYEGALDIAANILESPPEEEHVATRIKIYGDLEDPETPVWPAIVNILRNAFVEAFEKELAGTIDFEKVSPEGQQ